MGKVKILAHMHRVFLGSSHYYGIATNDRLWNVFSWARGGVFWALLMCFLFCYKFTPSQFITFPLCKKGTRLSKNLSLSLYGHAEGYFERRLKMPCAGVWLKMHCERTLSLVHWGLPNISQIPNFLNTISVFFTTKSSFARE